MTVNTYVTYTALGAAVVEESWSAEHSNLPESLFQTHMPA